jgi:hypothetical protein
MNLCTRGYSQQANDVRCEYSQASVALSDGYFFLFLSLARLPASSSQTKNNKKQRPTTNHQQQETTNKPIEV